MSFTQRDMNRVWYCKNCLNGPLNQKLFNKCCECQIGTPENGSTELIPVDSRGEPLRHNLKKANKRKSLASGRHCESTAQAVLFRPQSPGFINDAQGDDIDRTLIQTPREDAVQGARMVSTQRGPIIETNGSHHKFALSGQAEYDPSTCADPAFPKEGHEFPIIETQTQETTKNILGPSDRTFNISSKPFVPTKHGDDSTSASNVGAAAHTPVSASPGRARKRNREKEADPNKDGDEGEDDEGGKDRKRPTILLGEPDQGNLSFACPYIKYNYSKYSNWRQCWSSRFTDMSRLK